MAYRLLFVAVALVVSAISYLFFDQNVAHYFAHHYDAAWKIVTFFGDAAPYLIVTLLLYLLFRKSRPLFARKALYIFASVAISGIITDILKILIGRPRPKIFFSEHLFTPQWFELKASFWSMPSGHTTTAFAAGVGLGLLYPRWRYLFWIGALLVGLSRVALTKHFISDTIVGATIGALTALWLYKRMCDACK